MNVAPEFIHVPYHKLTCLASSPEVLWSSPRTADNKDDFPLPTCPTTQVKLERCISRLILKRHQGYNEIEYANSKNGRSTCTGLHHCNWNGIIGSEIEMLIEFIGPHFYMIFKINLIPVTTFRVTTFFVFITVTSREHYWPIVRGMHDSLAKSL